MACPCSSSTLRLFVRSLARIDLESTPISQRRTLRAHTTARNFTTYASRRFQTSQRYNDADNQHNEDDKFIPFDESAPGGERPTQTNWPSRRRAGGDDHEPTIALENNELLEGYSEDSTNFSEFTAAGPISQEPRHDDAYMEFTDEALDALVAESQARPAPRASRGRPSTATTTESEVLQIRRMAKPKARDGGLQMHFSAPRQERIVKPKADNEAGAAPTRPKAEAVSDGRPAWAGPDWEDRRQPWQIQKAALKEKFPEGWNPRKRLSPDALEGIRALHTQFPAQYTSGVLAEKFEVSPEAIRRILRTKWTPNEEEETDRKRRWFSRGEKVWGRMAELGMKPPKPWREAGVGRTEDGSPPKWAANMKKKWSVKNREPTEEANGAYTQGLERGPQRVREKLDLSDRIM